MYKTKYNQVREVLYAELSQAEYGSSYSYEKLTDIMGLDSQEFRYVIIQVQKMLEKEAQRTLRNDRGFGYSVANPKEHIDLSQKHHKRAKKQLRRAKSIIQSTDKSALDEQTKKRLDYIEQNLRAQQNAIRFLERRTGSLEAVQEKQIKVSQNLEQRMAEALARIEVLEEDRHGKETTGMDRLGTAGRGNIWRGQGSDAHGSAGRGMV